MRNAKVGDRWTDDVGNEYIVKKVQDNIIISETVGKAVDDGVED